MWQKDQNIMNAKRTRALSETIKHRHRENSNLQILARNDEILLTTKSCDAMHNNSSTKQRILLT